MPGRDTAGLDLAQRIVTTAQAMSATDQRSSARQACCLVEWLEDTTGWEYIDQHHFGVEIGIVQPRSSRLFCIAKISDSAAVFIPVQQPKPPPTQYDEYGYEDDGPDEQPEPAPVAVVRAAVAVTPATTRLMAARLAKSTYLIDPDQSIFGANRNNTESHRPGTLYLSTPLYWEESSPLIHSELQCDGVECRMHDEFIKGGDGQQAAFEEALKTMVELVKAVVPGLQL